MKLQFLGATGTVTGSKYLLESEGKKILIDCGLFQGYKELRQRNWSPLPVKPASIEAVALTHAHIDHSGYLPLLVKNGFKGPVYATKATIELCSVLLPDSGYLQEEDAKRANRYGYSRHEVALPLYTREDAEKVMKHFQAVDYDLPYPLFEDANFSWHRAGHILGSSFIQIEQKGIKTLFSGDLGRLHDPIMKPSAIMFEADYLILESTYGDRLHEQVDPQLELAEIINRTAKRGGTVLIPAFAVGRSQTMLYYLQQLKQKKLIPDLPIYLDSPMAIDATEILLRNQNEHRLGADLSSEICKIAKYTRMPEESIAIDKDPQSKIIISASGMLTGGRVLHHLKIFAQDARNTILLTGFQAAGTRGAILMAKSETIKVHGQTIPVLAEIVSLDNASAHADYKEILDWLSHFKRPPRCVYLTHGEPHSSLALKQHIESTLGWSCVIPGYLDMVRLD